MPLLQIKTTVEKIDKEVLEEIHRLGANILAEQIGKSTNYVMVIIDSNCSLSFAQDTVSPSAYMEVKNVGRLSPEKTQHITSKLTSLVSEKLATIPERIYLEFQESERHLWGWNGATFA